mgnify:CR=1 FL=1|jgi:OHCU decarboxylase|tara:strand:+ start:610 stop:1116 length:507 start_codon:yes stop_codon:yes gene_type:complete
MPKQINKLSESEFHEVFANIFENASWVAKKLYMQKPFENFDDLSKKIIAIFENADEQSKLKILKSHPDLADKTKIGLLTQDSKNEQNDAGLDECTKEEFNEFKNLNLKYKNKFGFPFIFAVKGKKKLEILENFKKRFLFNRENEFKEAIRQVTRIASLRLAELSDKFI